MNTASDKIRTWVHRRGEGEEFTISQVVKETYASRPTVTRVLRDMVKTKALIAEQRPYRSHILQTIFFKPIELVGAYIADYQGCDIMVCDNGVVMTQSQGQAGALETGVVTRVADPARYMQVSGLQWRVASDDEVVIWHDMAGLLNKNAYEPQPGIKEDWQNE